MTACIVIPTLNEQNQLAASVLRVHTTMAEIWDGSFSVLIADNGSTDNTPLIAAELAVQLPQVEFSRLEQRGRGGALRAAWGRTRATDVLAYMDVDLSTDLAHLPELLYSVASGDYDMAVGSRLVPGSKVIRRAHREILSRTYNTCLRRILDLPFHDTQCGFKSLSRTAALDLLPLVKNDQWFFDTELLAHAQWRGYRIREFPISWTEDPDSRVRLLPTIFENLSGLWRLWRLRQSGRH